MRRPFLLVATALLFAAGCDSGPTDPSRTEVLTGTLARTGTAVSTVTMHDTGNLRVTAVDLEQVAADGTLSAATGGITMTMGEGDAATCSGTGSFALVEGSVISLGLHQGSYCVRVSEPTAVPEGASLRYELKLEFRD